MGYVQGRYLQYVIEHARLVLTVIQRISTQSMLLGVRVTGGGAEGGSPLVGRDSRAHGGDTPQRLSEDLHVLTGRGETKHDGQQTVEKDPSGTRLMGGCSRGWWGVLEGVNKISVTGTESGDW